MSDHVCASIRVPEHRLRLASRIGGSSYQSLLSRYAGRFPIEFPKSPGVWFRFTKQICLVPSGSAIGAKLDLCDFAVARPSRAMDADARIRRDGFALSWLRDFRLDLDLGNWSEFANVPSPPPVCVIERLIITGEWLVCDNNALQPFDRA